MYQFIFHNQLSILSESNVNVMLDIPPSGGEHFLCKRQKEHFGSDKLKVVVEAGGEWEEGALLDFSAAAELQHECYSTQCNADHAV